MNQSTNQPDSQPPSLQSIDFQRTTWWLGVAGFVLLGGLAAAFWRERTLFSDIAFQTFLMLKDGGLQIMVGRWVAAATHVFPWLAAKFGLPLSAVLQAFSLGFVLWPLAVFAVCTGWLRQWRMGLLVLLCAAFFVKDTFFWVTSELAQGLSMLCLAFAWLHRRTDSGVFRWYDWPILAGFMATLVWGHPMLAFPTVFCALFFMLHRDEYALKWGRGVGRISQSVADGRGWGPHLAALLIFAAFWVLKNKILPLNWYDAMSQERAAQIWTRFPHWFDVRSNRDFLGWCWRDYWFALPGLVTVFGYYVWKKRWAKLALTASFSIGYLLVVNVSFADGDRQFYLESMYQPLTVFIGVPMLWDVLPFARRPRLAFGLLAVVLATSLVRIGAAHERWAQRLAWAQDFLAKTAGLPVRKLVVSENQVPMDLLGFSWGTPFEFLLMSALEHPDSARCLIVSPNPESLLPVMPEKRLLLGDKNFRFETFPKPYFNPQDTTEYVFFK